MIFGNAYSQAQSDAEIQERVDAISRTLRCVVCQNQSIYESNAPLAEDMRRAVEERVRAGDSDSEVRNYLRGPYGDYILLRPPFQLNTFLLWLGPIALLGFLFLWFWRRKPRKVTSSAKTLISDDDRQKLDSVLWDAADDV